jgi:hypothetical protein
MRHNALMLNKARRSHANIGRPAVIEVQTVLRLHLITILPQLPLLQESCLCVLTTEQLLLHFMPCSVVTRCKL